MRGSLRQPLQMKETLSNKLLEWARYKMTENKWHVGCFKVQLKCKICVRRVIVAADA